jgi:hypothetical protein
MRDIGTFGLTVARLYLERSLLFGPNTPIWQAVKKIFGAKAPKQDDGASPISGRKSDAEMARLYSIGVQ